MTTELLPEVLRAPGEPNRLLVGPPAGGPAAWLGRHRAELRALLVRHGHLLVRGLGLTGPGEFAEVRDALVERVADQPREETTPRTVLGEGVFSATDLPAPHTIRLHNEDSYSTVFPGLLLFACVTPARTGGATTVADSRQVRAGLPDALVEGFRRRGWSVTRTFSAGVGLTWQQAFGTDDPAEVEDYCRRARVGTTWLPDGRLRTVAVRPATVRHPVSGEELWFNHVAVFSEWTLDPEHRALLVEAFGADGLPQNTAYGDGGPVHPDDVAVLNRAYDAATVPVRWERGDLLLVDNLLSSHGRTPYTGRREVLVALGDPVRVEDVAPGGPVAAAPVTRDGEETA
jgi:hypothetical protein